MKYIKPHLSPELRAQITPHTRRDVKLTTAWGCFFAREPTFGLQSLAQKQTTVNNNKTTATITQQKEVLGAATHQEETSQPKEAPVSTDSFTQYTVSEGDTLFNISQKYNVRWDSIASINNLSEPYLLHAGQIVKIPQATTSKVAGKVYTIKNGDTLASIAKQFNITVADIIAVNPNLQKSDLITVGQIIKLP